MEVWTAFSRFENRFTTPYCCLISRKGFSKNQSAFWPHFTEAQYPDHS